MEGFAVVTNVGTMLGKVPDGAKELEKVGLLVVDTEVGTCEGDKVECEVGLDDNGRAVVGMEDGFNGVPPFQTAEQTLSGNTALAPK